MYATDYLQLSAQQSVKPNKVGPVLVTIGAHAALIAMLAVGLQVVVPFTKDPKTEVYNVPAVEKPIDVEQFQPIPTGPILNLPNRDVDIPVAPDNTVGITQSVVQDSVGSTGGGVDIDPVVQVTTTNASIVRSFQPPYPLVSRARDEEGTVILKILITPFGTAGEVQVEKSSGFSRLDEAAIKAVRDWKFAPAKRGSQAISMWVSVPVKFVLNSGR